MKKYRTGFALLELLVAITLFGIFSGVIISQMMTRNNQIRQTQTVNLQAQELKTLADSVRKYASLNRTTWVPGARNEYGIGEIAAASLIAPDFATRWGSGGVVGTTYLGQRYRVVSIVASAADAAADPTVKAGTVRSVVYQIEAPSEFATTRFRLVRTPSSFYSYHSSVATDVKGVPAATVRQGEVIARAPFGGYSKDVTAWLGGRAAQSSAVALVGFPDLESNGNELGGGGPRFTNCRTVRASSNCPLGNNAFCNAMTLQGYEQPSCPVGLTEAKRIPPCHTQYITTDVPGVGSLTIGDEFAVLPAKTQECPVPGSTEIPPLTFLFTTSPGVSTHRLMTLNNATIFRELCEYTEPFIRTNASGVCEERTERSGFARDALQGTPDPNGGALVPNAFHLVCCDEVVE